MVGFQCRALEQSGLQEPRRKESWLLNVDGCLKRTRVVDGLLLNIFVAHDSYLEWIVAYIIIIMMIMSVVSVASVYYFYTCARLSVSESWATV